MLSSWELTEGWELLAGWKLLEGWELLEAWNLLTSLELLAGWESVTSSNAELESTLRGVGFTIISDWRTPNKGWKSLE